MRPATLVAVAAACIAAPLAASACGPERLERAAIARIGPGADLHLAGGRVVRLAGVDGVRAEALPLRPGDPVAVGSLGEPDRWGREPALVFALPEGGEPVLMQAWLAGSGRALVRHEPTLGACWDVLRRAEAAAGAAPARPPEAGRYARIEGRVLRIGEGRTARFISVRSDDGTFATGMVSGRNLARLARAGVDLQALQGHIVRLRGIRSLRNPRIIAVASPEQIEIVR